MRSFELIRYFASREVLPIRIDEVAERITSLGIQDEINFVGVELDTNVLRGLLIQRRRRSAVYGTPLNVSSIYYDTRQGEWWRRLVCCKELLHILDEPDERTSIPDDVVRLVERIALPREFQILIEDGPQVANDRLCDLRAAAVLFPMSVRELLLPRVEDKTLDEDDVAQLVNIPKRYVRLVLSELWDGVYPLLARLGANPMTDLSRG